MRIVTEDTSGRVLRFLGGRVPHRDGHASLARPAICSGAWVFSTYTSKWKMEVLNYKSIVKYPYMEIKRVKKSSTNLWHPSCVNLSTPYWQSRASHSCWYAVQSVGRKTKHVIGCLKTVFDYKWHHGCMIDSTSDRTIRYLNNNYNNTVLTFTCKIQQFKCAGARQRHKQVCKQCRHNKAEAFDVLGLHERLSHWRRWHRSGAR